MLSPRLGILLNQEMKYIWEPKRLKKLTSLAYILARYFAVLSAVVGIWSISPPDQHLCNISSWIAGLSGWIITSSIDYLLCKRVCAMFPFYPTQKKLQITLYTLLFLQCLVSLVLLFTLLASLKESGSSANYICTTFGTKGFRILYWLLSTSYQLLLIAIAIPRALSLKSPSSTELQFTSSRITKLCVLEHALYVLLLTFCAISNILIFSPITYAFGSASILSLAGSRMIINLRRRLDRGAEVFVEPSSFGRGEDNNDDKGPIRFACSSDEIELT